LITQLQIPRNNVTLTRSLRDGAGNPCTSSYPISKYFLWTLFQGDYEYAAKTVLKRINYNRVGGDYGIYNNCYPFITGLDHNCAELSQVACIMNGYYNEVLALTIPEYDPSNLYRTNKTAVTLAYETERIITHITSISGQVYFRVKEVLEHLYWATYSDTADRINYQYISPLQYKANKDKTQKPKDIGSGVDAASDAVTGTFDGIVTTVKWLLILAGVGVAAYFIVPIITAAKSK